MTSKFNKNNTVLLSIHNLLDGYGSEIFDEINELETSLSEEVNLTLFYISIYVTRE